MKKADNRGVSLVELLVAVSIMAIIVVPLLHSFASSYKVNARSRQTMRATTLAQNEMEIFEKEKIADLVDPDKFAYSESRKDGYRVQAPASPSDNGCYVFSRIGIINDESGREEFDVYVTLNPKRADSYERYYNQNNAGLLSMNTISAVDSGTYVQRIRTENNEVDLDTIAYNFFNTNKKVTSSATLDEIKQNVKRAIKVDISRDVREIGTFTVAKVSYEYECSTFIVPEDKKYYREEQVIYNNSQNLDEAGNPVELKSLYLFYAPRYGITDANKADTIIVNNADGIAADIYIVRQDLLVEGGSTIQPTPMNYVAKLEIQDTPDAVTGKCAASYHTNLNVNEVPTEGLGQPVVLSLSGGSTMLRDELIDAMSLKMLGETQVKDRIYEMTVDVYEHGASPYTDSPVVTLSGTKLE